ncbi:MAG: hypothetical protein ACPLRW_05625 [Moorellales bacterium]
MDVSDGRRQYVSFGRGERVATLWVTRPIDSGEPLLDALRALREAWMVELALGHGLGVRYKRDGDCIEVAITGPPDEVACLVRDVLDNRVLADTLVVDLDPGEDRSPFERLKPVPPVECRKL